MSSAFEVASFATAWAIASFTEGAFVDTCPSEVRLGSAWTVVASAVVEEPPVAGERHQRVSRRS